MSDKRKRTNPNQFAMLVELMEKNPDMARGIGVFGSSKRNQKDYWDNFAEELNSLGPPSREGKDWHKVWLDYKQKLKQKISENKKKTIATGGGPFCQISLSPMEQAVDRLLSLSQAVNPRGNHFGVPSQAASLPSTDSVNQNVSEISGDIQEEFNQIIDTQQVTQSATEGDHGQESSAHQSSLPSLKRGINNSNAREFERLKLLQGQTDTQGHLLEISKSIDKNLLEIARYTRKTYEIEKDKLSLMKQKEARKEKENIEKNRRHKENIEIKLKKIELEMKKTS